MGIDRRDFLKGAAILGGATALSGLAACTPDPQPEQSEPGEISTVDPSTLKWDEEYDLVIVGGGGAGMIAAIQAAQDDPKATIVILEKMSKEGGSTIISGGNIGAMGTDNLKAFAESSGNDVYKNDTFEMYWEDKLAAGCYFGHPEIAKLFTFNSLDNFNWNESLGIKWNGSRAYESPVEMPSDWTASAVMQASQYLMTYNAKGESTMINRKIRYNIGSRYGELSGGAADFQCWLDNMKANPNASLVCDAPVDSIVREKPFSGDVLGVVLKNGKTIKAKRAVILAAGGFHANPAMVHLHDPRVDPSVESSGGRGCTGDMIIAAQMVGAQTVNMQCIQIDFGGSVKEPSMSGNSNSNPFSGAGFYIDVDRGGKRFWTEKPSDEQYMDAELMTLHGKGMKTWFRLGDSGSVASNRTPENLASFAANYGSVCNTIAELATAIGCNATTLQETIDRYNSFIDTKKDTEFGKPTSLLNHKIETPPFYVFEATYYCRTTPGGLQIDTNSQVVDLFGQPIPRLFAAGEVTGNVHGRFRNNGGDSMCDITCFGRLSGQNAVKLAPLS
ncbi:MAG: FAD-binding protein [Coriobacteriales bacterium]|jgi:succinate dehydrogenase/fumarate reductase flavoprotein subunit|nr:FAD-binding protein [Coriobacteriales bacterium]